MKQSGARDTGTHEKSGMCDTRRTQCFLACSRDSHLYTRPKGTIACKPEMSLQEKGPCPMPTSCRGHLIPPPRVPGT
eukprot:1156183-Pelagomonas_calceolata.AAC.10